MKNILSILKSWKFKVAASIFVTLLALAGLSYGFYLKKNNDKNVSKQEVTVKKVDTSTKTKPEENKPIVDAAATNSNTIIDTPKTVKKPPTTKNNTPKTAKKVTSDKTENRKFSAEVEAAIEHVRNLTNSYDPNKKIYQNQWLIDKSQKKIDEDTAKIAESNTKIAQYEQEIVKIQALMEVEGITPEEYDAYYAQIEKLRSLITDELTQIYKLTAEIAIQKRFIEQAKQR